MRVRNARQPELLDLSGPPVRPAHAGQLQEIARFGLTRFPQVVATKEGGAITGEERLREYLAGLYGDVNAYEGRPTDSQVARADALTRELEDVVREFRALTDKALPAINQALGAKNLQPIVVPAE